MSGLKVGRGLSRNPKHQVEVEVFVALGAEDLDGARDRLRPARRSSVSSRCGRKLCAPSEMRVTPLAEQHPGELGRDGLGVAFDRHIGRNGEPAQQPREQVVGEQRRRAAADVHRLGGQRLVQIELGQERVDVGGMHIARARSR